MTAPTTQAEQEDAVRESIARAMCVAYKLQPDMKHYGKAPDGSFCGISEAGPEVPVELRPIPRHWHHGWRRFLHIADALLAGPIATLRTERDQLAAKLEEAEEEVDIVRQDSSQQMQMLDRIAKRLGLAHDEGLEDAEPFLAAIDQLAADLRKAREALKVAQSALAMLTEPQAIRTTRVHEAWATAVDAELQCRRALTPDHKDAGGPAKGKDHGA